MRKITALLLTMALVITMFPVMMSADSNDPLWDVEVGKWYYKDIHEVFARGMITGVEEYGKVSFKPNDPVTQIQAVAMVLRYLDLENNAKNLAAADVSNRLSLIGVDEAKVPSWAKAHIAYAITLGYIKSKNDALDIKASRAWISQLLVRVLEKEAQALSPQMMVQTSFADDRDIPSHVKGYVNTVVSLEIIKGSLENGALKFNPNGSTTRAEMATILKRLDNHRTVPSNYSKTVVIKNLTETGIEFQNEDARFETLNMNNPTVFKYNQKQALRDINTQDEARIAIRNNEIVFVDVTGKGVLKENVVFGKLDDINQVKKVLWVNLEDGTTKTYDYTESLIVRNEQGITLGMNELQKGKEVQITLATDQQTVTGVVVAGTTSPSQPQDPTITHRVEGAFFVLDEGKRRITIRFDNGSYENFTYDEVTYVTGGKRVSDLKEGDRVLLNHVNNKVTVIEFLNPVQDNTTLKGVIESFNEKTYSITVQLADEKKVFDVSTTVVVNIDGVINATFANLKNGYKVNFDVHNGLVTKIVVEGDSYSKEVTGRFDSFTKTGILTFKTDTDIIAKKMADDVYVEMEGVKRTLADLQERMRVIVTLTDDVVTKIVLDNKRQGVIKSINTTTRKVVVTQDGKDTEYTMLAGLPVDLFGVASPKMTDLAVGHEIQFYLNINDELKSIIVSQTLNYTVISVDTTKKTLNVIRNAVPTALGYNDKVELVIPGKTNPTWSELKAAQIQATFFGKQLIKVEKR